MQPCLRVADSSRSELILPPFRVKLTGWNMALRPSPGINQLFNIAFSYQPEMGIANFSERKGQFRDGIQIELAQFGIGQFAAFGGFVMQ